MQFFRMTFLLALFSSLFGGERVVLFNDTSLWYHWGCTGTSTALKEGIESLGFEIEAIPINTTYALKEVPEFEEFKSAEKFALFCQANGEVVQAIGRADAVLITAEGTMHDLRFGPRALLYLAYISKEFFQKHVEIINHSAYPKDDPLLSMSFIGNFAVEKETGSKELKRAEAIYKEVYSLCDFVAIREPLSQGIMEEIGVQSVLSFDCLPLYIRRHYHTPKKILEKTLVLAGSVAFLSEGIQKLSFYLEGMIKNGFRVKILIGAAQFPSKDDVAFVEALKTCTKAPFELVNAFSMEEWLDTINHATLFVSGRFHHSIAAFCLDTPFIALNSNTHKVHAICSFLGEKEPLLFSDPNLLEKLQEETKYLLSQPPLNHSLKVDEICQLAERNFEGLLERVIREKDHMGEVQEEVGQNSALDLLRK